jgi:alkylation response protein AidB-like acyl-CoA dehydrogenase
MVVQFELGTKQLEDRKRTAAVISTITANGTKEIVKELISKSYGCVPSDKAAYSNYLGLVIALEEIAKTYPEAASILADQVVAQELVAKYGNGSLNAGEISAILCAEPGNADVKGLSTKAVKNGSNWNIQGKKIVRNEHLYADKYLVYAIDEEGKTRVFAIPEKDITVSQITKTIAGANINLNQVELNLNVADSSNIAVVTDNMERLLSVARTLVAAVACGIGHSAVANSISAAKEVKGTDNVSISGTQSMQFTLADMFSELESGKTLTYYSADLIDNGKANVKYATMAKVQSTDAAANNSMQSLQVLGNLGYLADNDFANLIRVAVDSQTKGGTNRVQKNQVYKYMLA